jgi:hypothetical protein
MKLKEIQRMWLMWLVTTTNGRMWLDEHIDTSVSSTTIPRLHRVVIDNEYDTLTQELLNTILSEFKKDGDIGIWWNHFYKSKQK